MSNKPDLISLQGELFLAKMVNGAPAGLRSVGNMPDLKLAIKSESVDHFESKTGNRAKDAVLRKQTGVEISGTLEELNKENVALILSGKSIEVTSSPIVDVSLGSVEKDSIIDLGHRNLSNVTFKDGSDVAIPNTKYEVDEAFGTVVFNEAVTGDVKWSGTAGVVDRVTVADNLGGEYRFFFKGIDTYSGDKVAVTLWRVEFSPETELGLINEEWNSCDISGECLADISKAKDNEVGIFGHIDRFRI